MKIMICFKVLSKYNPIPEDMIENICEIVFTAFIEYLLAEKHFSEQTFYETDYTKTKEMFLKNSIEDIEHYLQNATKVFLETYFQNSEELFLYLSGTIHGIVQRIKQKTTL